MHAMRRCVGILWTILTVVGGQSNDFRVGLKPLAVSASPLLPRHTVEKPLECESHCSPEFCQSEARSDILTPRARRQQSLIACIQSSCPMPLANCSNNLVCQQILLGALSSPSALPPLDNATLPALTRHILAALYSCSDAHCGTFLSGTPTTITPSPLTPPPTSTSDHAFCGPGCVGRDRQAILACGTRSCAIPGAGCANDPACAARLTDILRMDDRLLLTSDLQIPAAVVLFDCADRHCGTNFLGYLAHMSVNASCQVPNASQMLQTAIAFTSVPTCRALGRALYNQTVSDSAVPSLFDNTASNQSLCTCLSSSGNSSNALSQLLPTLQCPIEGQTTTDLVDLCVSEGFSMFDSTVCRSLCETTRRRPYSSVCNCSDFGYREVDCFLRASGHVESASSLGMDLEGVSGADVVCGPGLTTSNVSYNFPPNTERIDFRFNVIPVINQSVLLPFEETHSTLRVLLLSVSQVSIVRGDAFSRLSHLADLRLDGNFMTLILCDTFSNLTALERLSLRKNRITLICTNAFQDLSHLTGLDMSENSLTQLPQTFLSSMTALQSLQLQQNSITRIEYNALEFNVDLTQLSLQSNAITSLPQNLLSRLPAGVLRLNVLQNVITDCGLSGRDLLCNRCSTGVEVQSVPVSSRALNTSWDQYCPPFRVVNDCRQGLENFQRRLAELDVLIVREVTFVDWINCSNGPLFENFADGMIRRITFTVEYSNAMGVSQAASTCVDPGSGLTIMPLLEGDFNATLYAFDAVGTSLALADWSMSVHVRPALELVGAWPLVLSENGVRSRHNANTTIVLSRNGEYRLEPPNSTRNNLFRNVYQDDLEAITYGLRYPDLVRQPPPGQVLIDASSGIVQARVSETREDYCVRLIAIDGGQREAVLLEWSFSVQADDTESSRNGPNSAGCGEGGTAIDIIPFDHKFACQCHHGYAGANCEVTLTSQRGDHNSASTAGVFVASVVAGILVLVGVVIAGREFVRHHRRVVERCRPHNFEPQLEDLVVALACDNDVVAPYEILRHDIQVFHDVVLGHGQFGMVLKGLHTPTEFGIYADPCEVAVKMLKLEATEDDRLALLTEATLTAQFDHENVISLIGVVTVGSPTLLILPFCKKGALQDVLQQLGTNFQMPTSEIVTHFLDFAVGIACGMTYLSMRRFVHRDLATRNVMVTASNVCKVADFGMSRELTNSQYYRMQSERSVLPIRWTAIEALEEHRFAESSDVWSFGITMHELFNFGTVPFRGWQNAYVVEQLKSGYRPEKPDLCPTVVFTDVITPCLLDNPMERPKFRELTELLKMHVKRYSQNQEFIDARGLGSCGSVSSDLRKLSSQDSIHRESEILSPSLSDTTHTYEYDVPSCPQSPVTFFGGATIHSISSQSRSSISPWDDTPRHPWGAHSKRRDKLWYSPGTHATYHPAADIQTEMIPGNVLSEEPSFSLSLSRSSTRSNSFSSSTGSAAECSVPIEMQELILCPCEMPLPTSDMFTTTSFANIHGGVPSRSAFLAQSEL